MDYYELLGVSEDSSEEQIRRTFRQRARTCHPDLFPNDPEKQELFLLLCKAVQTLADSKQRRAYDRFRRAPTSVADFLERNPAGMSAVQMLLQRAPKAPRPGADLCVQVVTDPSVLKQGGVITVTGLAGQTIQLQIPPDTAQTPWCRIRGFGESGQNGGEPGDLFVHVCTNP